MPGKPDESHLMIELITQRRCIMPPPESNNKLTKREKDILDKGLNKEQNGKYTGHSLNLHITKKESNNYY